jgi:hypothetical protein
MALATPDISKLYLETDYMHSVQMSVSIGGVTIETAQKCVQM